MPPSRAHREIRRAARQVPLRVPVDSPWRDGLPLPALIAADAASQLVWRVLGPLPTRVKPILAWVAIGLPGDWTPGQLTYWTGFVRLTGRRTPLQPTAGAELAFGSATDPVAVRRRSLFGLPEPTRSRWHPPNPGMRILSNANTSARLLAAVGPLTTDELLDAHRRARQYRATQLLTADELGLGLTYLQATYDAISDTWTAPAGTTTGGHARHLLAAVTPGVDYRREELLEVLMAAGLSSNTANNQVSWSPLLQKTGPNRYLLRTPPVPSTEPS